MEPLLEAFGRYIGRMTGSEPSIDPRQTAGLPVFLRQRFGLYAVRFGRNESTGLVLRNPDDFSPAAFEKQVRQFPASVQDSYVLIAEQLPGYVRNRLVERGIPFVVPDVQLHWPDLGIAARTRGGRKPSSVGQHLSPATQATVIAVLSGSVRDGLAARDMAKLLGYTRMTMSRVFDELESVGLARTTRHRHERRLHFSWQGQQLWNAARPRLRDPVRKTLRFHVEDISTAEPLLAGESALAKMSMLVAPAEPVYAVGPNGWSMIRDTAPEVIPVGDTGTCLLQIWAYDPTIAGRDGRVDPFSLALSLAEIEDERVTLALEEMMETIAW
ncbi:MarR family transcriptional regulator [Azospirillum sp. INR13]|uniref:MarR family transcriptional regulator n=1 Tax=Azospirillum sp. INR13 TaxID=2596919 RepID=UPI00189204EC|nr:MarR family transcriptional regulator [Azospirillum sp. INR13]MBF5093107.1 MarR family transcriptional regulator [Azospirillum sp. INR13]